MKLQELTYFVVAPEYGGGSGGLGMVILDDCNFHESVRLDDFQSQHFLTLVCFIQCQKVWS
jgi:hypothetical protein